MNIKLEKSKISIIVLSIISTVFTWVLNHKIGLGPIVANGIIGILSGLFLSKTLSGTTYAASFVGMSSTSIIPSIAAASVGGIVVGIVLANTQEIYAGLGGKGGTAAALSTLIIKTIMSMFR